MKKRDFKIYSTLLTLYLAQSVPTSFYSTAIPVIMRMENYSLESIGYIQLVRLPWILKFMWAPLLDKNSTGTAHYKKWIIVAEIFYAAVIVSIGFFNLSADFNTIVILLVLAFSIAATQDIATDAYAILILKKSERSIGNIMQTSGNFLGGLIGSGLLLILYQYIGWMALLVALGAFLLLALIPLFLFREQRQIKTRSSETISFFEYIYFFRQKRIGTHILLLLLLYTSIIGILTMFKPYLVDLGFNSKDIGLISGVFGTSCGAIMAIPAGFLLRKKGIKISLIFFTVFNLLVAIYFFVFTFTDHDLVLIYIGTGLLWSSFAMSSVFLYTLGMNMVRSGREGTDFTVQIVLAQLGALAVSSLSGKLSDAIGYRGFFAIEIGMAVLLIVLLPLILKNNNY